MRIPFRLTTTPPLFSSLTTPVLHAVQTLLGQGHNTVLIVDAHDIGFNLIADLDNVFQLHRRIVGVLFLLDIAGMLGAQVNLDLCGCNIYNDTDNLISCI